MAQAVGGIVMIEADVDVLFAVKFRDGRNHPHLHLALLVVLARRFTLHAADRLQQHFNLLVCDRRLDTAKE